MKIGNYLYPLLLVILLASSVFAWFSNLKLKEHLHELMTKTETMAGQEDVQQMLSQRVVFHSMVAKSFLVPPGTELLNKQNEVVKVDDLVKGKKILCFKISKRNCESCVESELAFLERFNKTENPSRYNLILITDDYTPRELLVLEKRYDIKYPLFNIPGSIFRDLPIERLNQPYLFALDSTLMANMIFMPDRKLPMMSEEYYAQAHRMLSK